MKVLNFFFICKTRRFTFEERSVIISHCYILQVIFTSSPEKYVSYASCWSVSSGKSKIKKKEQKNISKSNANVSCCSWLFLSVSYCIICSLFAAKTVHHTQLTASLLSAFRARFPFSLPTHIALLHSLWHNGMLMSLNGHVFLICRKQKKYYFFTSPILTLPQTRFLYLIVLKSRVFHTSLPKIYPRQVPSRTQKRKSGRQREGEAKNECMGRFWNSQHKMMALVRRMNACFCHMKELFHSLRQSSLSLFILIVHSALLCIYGFKFSSLFAEKSSRVSRKHHIFQI